LIEENYSERDKLVYEGHHKVINDSLLTTRQSRTYNNCFQTKHNPYFQNTNCGLSPMQYKEDYIKSHLRIFWPYHPWGPWNCPTSWGVWW